MFQRFLVFVAIVTISSACPARAEPVSVPQVKEALDKAIRTIHSRFSVEGGYPSEWTLSTGQGHSEHRSSSSVISIQPPGTTSLGPAFLRAYQLTGSPKALEAARNAAICLARCQLSSGGWDSDFDFDPKQANRYHLASQFAAGDKDPGKRRHRSTLDDNKTQSALSFLLEFVHTVDESKGVRDALDFGLASLLAAQDPTGGWPQKYEGAAREKAEPTSATFPEDWPREWPDVSYSSYLTLNDGNLYHIARLLLKAHELTQEERFVEAAIRLGDFLRLAQLPAPQRGWAQQYDFEMHPVWARRFEPPAVSSIETYSAIETLFELWAATGMDRFREPIPEALAWLRASKLDDGSWARFYELKTNRPLYCEAGSYRLTYDDSQLPTHYGFQIPPKWGNRIDRMEAALEKSLAEARKQRSGERSPSSWEKEKRNLEKDVSRILSQRNTDGIWCNGDSADARTWTRNLTLLCNYLEAAGKSSVRP